MYSYSVLVQVELLSMDDLMSDLENCFESLSLRIMGTNLVVGVVPTGSCNEQMVQQTGTPGTATMNVNDDGPASIDNTYINAVTLQIGIHSFQLSVSAFVLGYQGMVAYSVTFPGLE